MAEEDLENQPEGEEPNLQDISPQAGEAYKCECGYITDDLKKFRNHLFHPPKDIPGPHKSLGRVDLSTGQITMPPFAQRSKEQMKASIIGKKKEKGDLSNVGKTTEVLGNASEIRLVPRIYTIDYTPIMRIAQEAAMREWGWRKDMPLANFLDTCLYNYFKEHGLTIGTYSIDKPESESEPEPDATAAGS